MPAKTRRNRTLLSDWSRVPNELVLALALVLTRLPLINLGFGLDADAWRLANTAFDLRHHAQYHASRFPGYPLPEFVNALLIKQGWLATNILTVLLALLSVLVFMRILKALNCPNQGILIIAYAFLPLLWINSTNTMDYTWALCFIMCAWLLATKKRMMLAGLTMGLAIGSRLPTLILILPFLYLCYSETKKITGTLQFLFSAIITTAVLYIPLFMTYGFEFLQRYPTETSIMQTGYLAMKHFGVLTIVVLIVLVIASLDQMRRLLAERDRHFIFSLFAALAGLITYIAVPYHIEYVIPVIPFALLLIFRTGKKWLLILFVLLALSHALVSVINVQHLGRGRIRTTLIEPGTVFRNIAARQEQLAFVKRLMQARIDSHSVVIIGTWLPVLAYASGDVSSVRETKKMYDTNRPGEGVQDFQHDILYRYLLTRSELEDLIEQNYTIYYIDGIREFTSAVHGYDLADHETTYIDI
ncbi:MAG: hypothetical protein PVH23_06040 [candidate division WOR-3 bacterium]|jgi:hypothetical protein